MNNTNLEKNLKKFFNSTEKNEKENSKWCEISSNEKQWKKFLSFCNSYFWEMFIIIRFDNFFIMVLMLFFTII